MLISFLRGDYVGQTPQQIVLGVLMMFFALCLSFSFHEFMHAFVASWLGDDTARNQGRVTLNPISHVDPVGAAMLLLFGIGWGKPVPCNTNYLSRFKSKRLMCILVYLAGVAGNFVLALLASIIYTIAGVELFQGHYNEAIISLVYIFYYLTEFSLGLLAFNLLPIPPLDGFHVLEELLPYRTRYSNGYRSFIAYAPRVLLLLVFLGSMLNVPILSYILNIIEFPFRLLINLIDLGIASLFL